MSKPENTSTEAEAKNSIRVASIVAAIAALATIVASFIGAFVKNETQNSVAMLIDDRVYEEISEMKSDLKFEFDKLRDARTQIEAITELSPDSLPPKDVATLTASLASIDKRLSTLEDGLGENPGKALSTPLLRKDIQALQKSSREGITATQKEIERIYDQNKWFIGLIATMAVGVLGLAVGNLLPSKK